MKPTDEIANRADAAAPVILEMAKARRGARRGVPIRSRLTLLVVACVLPVWIAAGFLVYNNYLTRRALTEQRMLDTARALTQVVDRELASMQSDLRVLATSPSLGVGDLNTFYRQAQVVAGTRPGVHIVLSDSAGQELINTSRPLESHLPRRSLPEVVRKVFATGEPVITNIYKAANSGDVRVSLEVPVFRDGKVIYDLAMTVPAEFFAEILLQQHLPPEWVGRIYDSNQFTVTRTRFANQFVGRQAGPGLAERIRGASEGTVEAVNFENVAMFNGFKRSATSGWTVVIGAPRAMMMAEIWRWLFWALAGTGLLSVAGVGLALLMAHHIASSIQALVVPASALGSGEPVTIQTFDLTEINELGESLQKASVLIQQRAQERERAAAARRETEDLKLFSAELERSIAEHKRTERALRESEERFRLVVEDAPIGIYIQTDGIFRYLNPAALSMFGAESIDQIVGQGILDRMHPESRTAVVERARVVKEERKAVPLREERRLRLDGSAFDAENTAVPFYFEGRNGAIVFFRDITDRNQKEEERRALEQQLRQAQKIEAVGRLAGGIAHDFNNLLMVIQSYAELLQATHPSLQDLQKNTQEILKAANRGASLTGQMLAFSRKQIIAPILLDLSGVIEETAKMLRRLIGEDIEFRVEPVKSLWKIKADPDQIVQVLMNLCVNARDAMPQGGTLTIETQNVTIEQSVAETPYVLPGKYVKLSVADTGAGIRKELQERVFEPFFTTKEVGKGTGLGLAMVYGIVKQSGGYVWISSELGQGTCFTILWPKGGGEVVPELAGELGTLQSGAETLLVAEDEEALRDAMCGYLERLGYKVLPADSGQHAIAIAEQFKGHIDLLVTDVVMPRMSGRELSQTLTRISPDLKTIYMSGYTDDAVLRHGIHEHDATFLQKPFSLGTLAGKVRETLGRTEPVR